jgi:hypothetical protein
VCRINNAAIQVALKGCNTPVISVSHNKNVFTIVPGLLLKVTTIPDPVVAEPWRLSSRSTSSGDR